MSSSGMGATTTSLFTVPDLNIVLVDPHRPGHELEYHPGEANLRMADVVVISKIDTADLKGIDEVRRSIAKINPKAIVVEGASPLNVEKSAMIKGKKVLVVEDGPTLTHGEMEYGAGYLQPKSLGPGNHRPQALCCGQHQGTYEKYSHMTSILPAMGYGQEQMAELEETINSADCDVVVIGTPIDLSRVAKIDKPSVRVRYYLQEIGRPTLEEIIKEKL
jgi:predicted GTPase